MKLASELSRRSTGTTLYVLDEPTTGLHFDDVRKLLDVLNRLVDQGNTVIVIEHNLDVVKSADWIIDMGPEGGDRGGAVVAEGSPEQVAAVGASYTGQVLAPMLGILPGIAAPVVATATNGKAPKASNRRLRKAPTRVPAVKKSPVKPAAAKKLGAEKPAARRSLAKATPKAASRTTAKKNAAPKPATKKVAAGRAPAKR